MGPGTHTQSQLYCSFNSVIPLRLENAFLMVLFSQLRDGVRLVQVKSGPQMVTLYKL